jgi:hypothetical protein
MFFFLHSRNVENGAKVIAQYLAMTELILIHLLNDDFVLNDSHYHSISLTLFPPPFPPLQSLSRFPWCSPANGCRLSPGRAALLAAAVLLLTIGLTMLVGPDTNSRRSELEQFVLEPIGRASTVRQVALAQAYRDSMLL